MISSTGADYNVIFYVGAGSCGLAAGAGDVIDTLHRQIAARKLSAEVRLVGCMGLCSMESLVDVEMPGASRVCFSKVDTKGLMRILDMYVEDHVVPADLLLGVFPGYPDLTATVAESDGALVSKRLPRLEDLPFMRKQVRRVLTNCGRIDPEDLVAYRDQGGFVGLRRALYLDSRDVVQEISRSGLRGRGGGGFPTGRKWGMALDAKADCKYFICNADEGDPGAFMDRSLLEGDPHRVLEGLTIGGYAIGARYGFVYVRAEYPLAVRRLQRALANMYKSGFLGGNICGSSFQFDIEIKIGAGAFVCGEETALMASIEGRRGTPHTRPPYPTESGLWGRPTIINNVETLANVPDILSQGADWFRSVGTANSTGTKVFSLTGSVKNTGLIEVPMGITMREIIFDLGGGIEGGRPFKAAQIGGPSGGCLPEMQLDTAVDYDSLLQAGAIMGSGGLVVMDDRTCMVDVARFFLNFTRSESCGRCVPCREGTQRLYEMVDGILTPQAQHRVCLEDLEQLAVTVEDTAACALGNTAPNPVLSTLRHFREEYEAHLLDARCPAGQCKPFLTYSIDPDLCRGCGLCKSSCPVEAIAGEKNEVYVIDAGLCSHCAACMDVCNFSAVKAS